MQLVSCDNAEVCEAPETDRLGFSCSHQTQQKDGANQIQGPMPSLTLHARLDGLGQSG